MEEDHLAQKGEESWLLVHQVEGPTMQCPMPTKLCTLEQALQYRKTAIDEYEKLKPIAE
jgi:hypothetical protein